VEEEEEEEERGGDSVHLIGSKTPSPLLLLPFLLT